MLLGVARDFESRALVACKINGYIINKLFKLQVL